MKKLNRKKKSIKPIKILKKLAGSIRFRFYKPKAEKTEPNRTQTEKNPSQTGKKPSQTKKTEPKQKKPSQTGLNRFLS